MKFMRRVLDKESGNQAFAKYNEIARYAWDICMAAAEWSPEQCSHLHHVAHSARRIRKAAKVKTIGKLLDEKITLEGLFTIVMRSIRHDGQYRFTTQNNGL